MHFVPLSAVFLHQCSRKGHRLCPTGRIVSGTWMHVQQTFLWLGHGWSSKGNALEHGRYSSLGMDVLVVGYSLT